MFSHTNAYSAPEHASFNSLAMEDDMFMGAPPLPRVDTGDAFDRLLQLWMDGPGGSEPTHRSSALHPDATTLYAPHSQHSKQLPQQLPHDDSAFLQPLCFEDPPTSSGPSSARLQQQALYFTQPNDLSISEAPQHPPHSSAAFPLPHPATHRQQAYEAERVGGSGQVGPAQQKGQQAPLAQADWAPYRRLTISPETSSVSNTEDFGSIPDAGRATKGPLSKGVATSAISEQSLGRDSPQQVTHRAAAAAGPNAMPGIEATVAAAKNAWPKKRRATTNEESREKERARNRRAQKRFREREKERQEQRMSEMATLEAQLMQLTKEKEALEKRNAALEQAEAIREQQRRFDACPAKFDPQLFLEVEIGDPADLQPCLTTGGHPQQLSADQVAKLSFRDHAKLYKGYVDALKAQLVLEAKPEVDERIGELCQELCSLNLAVALSRPADFAAFQSSKLDEMEGEPQHAHVPDEVWRRCLGAVALSKDQKRSLLEERRSFLARLGPLLKQRWELHRLVATAFSCDGATASHRSSSHALAMEAVEKLRENLKQEQIMLVQTMCATFQQHLAPRQTAVNIVTAYPFHPDVPMLVDLVASETPGEPSAAELMGVHEVPPS